MFVIGLTGGMAAGKSTVTDYLKIHATQVIDADEISKELIAPGTIPYRELLASFGKDILGSDGTIDRTKLGQIVFADQQKLERLNELTHPSIVAEIRKRLEELKTRLPLKDVVILRAPLLIETGLVGFVDKVVLVTAPEVIRITRIKKQRGLSEEECRQRLNAQLPDSAKRKYADFVIENDEDLDKLKSKVEMLWEDLEEVM